MKAIGTLTLTGLALVLLISTATGATSGSGGDVTSVAPMALNSMINPPAKLATAMVLDVMGKPVGSVHRVETDANGKPIKVDIALLGSQQIIGIDSSNLSYDEAANVVTVNLDQSQIVQMASLE